MQAGRREGAAAALVILASACVIVLHGNTSNAPDQLAQRLSPAASLMIDNIARGILERAAGKSGTELGTQMLSWHQAVHAAALMEHPWEARMQMLAMPDSMMQGMHRGRSGSLSLAEGPSKLCLKKQMLVDKFDELLRKLGVNVEKANNTMSMVSKEFQDAMNAWLDAAANYRLSVERAKEAEQGAKFATDEYEKWAQAHKVAKKSRARLLPQHAAQRAEIANEKEVIKQIMRLIGVLHDVKASEKSIAAGGRDSVKNAETGVSDPYAIKVSRARIQLQAKMAQLKQLASKEGRDTVKMSKLTALTQKLAVHSSLAVYSETEEVATILKAMLDDLDVRVAAIDAMDAKARAEVSSTFDKMVDWEKQMVKLGDAADKARASISGSEDKREQLTATKRSETQTYASEKEHYDLTINPYEREIYIITLIKNKIIEHCDKEAAGLAS